MITHNLVGWLLSLANARPPYWTTEFYALKDRLLRAYGQRLGSEWQHIRDICWDCTDGVRDGGYRCHKCGGTGAYLEFWVELETWSLGKYRFHIPGAKSRSRPDAPVAIEGRIEKTGNYRNAQEAALWLALIFDPPAWASYMLSSKSMSPGMRPMLLAQWIGWEVRRVRSWFTIRECISCAAPFIRPSNRAIYFQCANCAARQPIREIFSDGIPF